MSGKVAVGGQVRGGSSMTSYAWINLYPLAKVEGFVYFKAYVNQQTNQVAGWVNRTGVVEPYSYSIYWIDQTGKTQVSTRGTWQHADWAVQGAVASVLAAGVVLENMAHLPSRKLSAHQQTKRLMSTWLLTQVCLRGGTPQ